MKKTVLLAILLTALHQARNEDIAPVAEPNLMDSEPGKTSVSPEQTKVSPEAIDAWRSLRFGIFIHWGPVSLKGEELSWSRGGQIPIEEYDSLYKQFNPVKFNAEEWVNIAKSAGMKYMVFVTKHTDGFCMWDTKQTDYNIMNSPFGRDIVKEIAGACRKQGLKLGAYYSTPDWHHPDFPLTGPRGGIERPVHDLDRYTDYLKAQITELMKNYGPLLTLWFDMPHRFDAARGQGVIKYARRVQPDIVINNRTGAEGDYDTAERRIGGFNMDRPWETCNTLGFQWSWKPDDSLASLEECLEMLVMTVGSDGNFLLNVGPMPDGRIEPRQVDRLKEIGAWMKVNGEGIYGTRGGPYKPSRSYASTRKGNTIYLHALKWDGDKIVLPPLPAKVLSASVLGGGKAAVEQSADRLTLRVHESDRKPPITVVKLETDADAMALQPIPALLTGKATATNTRQNLPEYAPDKALDQDPGTYWATDDNAKEATLEVDLGESKPIHRIMIDEANAGWKKRIRQFTVEYKDGEEWKKLLDGTETKNPNRRKIHRFIGEVPEPVTARYFRLRILKTDKSPDIREFVLE